MPVRRFCALLVLILAFCFTAEGEEHVITLYYPPDKTVMEFGLLNVALGVSEEFEGKILVFVNGLKEKEIMNDRQMKCFSVFIEPGVNEISVVAKAGKREVQRHTFSVFRRSDLSRDFRKPPKEFKKQHFHVRK